MALIDRIQRNASALLRTKANPVEKVLISANLPGPVWTPGNYNALANEGYVQNTDVHACVNIIGNACGGINWLVSDKKSKNPTAIESGPLVDLLRKPNPRQGQASFFSTVVCFRQIAGNSYIVRVGPSENKPPLELWPLRPDRMRVNSGSVAVPISGFTYMMGENVPLLPDARGQTVMHWKTFHPTDDWYGLSPIQAAARRVDAGNSAEAWNVSLFQNSCRPSGALVTQKDQTLTPTQFDRLQDQVRTQYSGSMNAKLPLILEGGLDWKEMSLSPVEMDWLNSDEATTRKICAVFGVPPELIGIMSKGGMNDTNFVTARRKLYMETILPLMDSLRDEMNLWLAPLFGDRMFIDYDRDDIEAIQEDRKIVWDRMISAVKSTILTPNEARDALGYDAIEGGDKLLLPINVAPMGELPASALATSLAPTKKPPVDDEEDDVPARAKPSKALQPQVVQYKTDPELIKLLQRDHPPIHLNVTIAAPDKPVTKRLTATRDDKGLLVAVEAADGSQRLVTRDDKGRMISLDAKEGSIN